MKRVCQNEVYFLHFDTHTFSIPTFRINFSMFGKPSMLLKKDGDLCAYSCLRVDAIGDFIFIKNA